MSRATTRRLRTRFKTTIVGWQIHHTTEQISVPNRFRLNLRDCSSPKKLCSDWTHLENATGQCFSLHQRRRMEQLLPFHQPTGDPRWHQRTVRGNDYAHPRMPAAPHRTASGIHQKTDEKTGSNRHQQ